MSLKETVYEYTLIKSSTELCLTTFCLYFVILYNTTGISHQNVCGGTRIIHQSDIFNLIFFMTELWWKSAFINLI